MIESWGRGIEKISRACEASGTSLPLYDVDPNGLMLTFPEPEWLSSVAPEFCPPEAGLGDGLGDTRIAILQKIKDDPKISTKTLANQLSLSTTAMDRHLKFLREAGKLVRIGSAKSGHWKVKAK